MFSFLKKSQLAPIILGKLRPHRDIYHEIFNLWIWEDSTSFYRIKISHKKDFKVKQSQIFQKVEDNTVIPLKIMKENNFQFKTKLS